jgi:chemotaxis protein CheX
MTVRVETLLDEILLRAASELFEACSVGGARPAGGGRWDGARPAPELAGIATIGGSRLHGAVVIAASFAFFARTRPDKHRVSLEPQRAADWLLARDWAAEMANQLRGRIVNRLPADEWDIELRHASALSGEPLVRYAPHSSRSTPVQFAAGNDKIWVWLDVEREAEPEAPPQARAAAGAVAACEGDILIF